MAKEIGQVELYNNKDDRYEAATLSNGIYPRHLDDVDNYWTPVLSAKATQISCQCLKSNGQFDIDRYNQELAANDMQDAHWDWRNKLRAWEGSLAIRHFALECGGQTQALMAVDLTYHARHPEQYGEHLCSSGKRA